MKKFNVQRTPNERFKNLPDFDFKENYLTIDGLQIHYIDEGPKHAKETILLLHGQPSWSFLYRKMIPILSKQTRVIAFDFIGFGKSDKYTDKEAYSTELHLNTLTSVIEQLNLTHINLVMQDWGGPIGLLYATQHQDRIKRLVLMNTLLSYDGYLKFSNWKQWRVSIEFGIYKLFTQFFNFKMATLISAATTSTLDKAVLEAYDAPFPTKAYKAGASAWPSLVPLTSNSPHCIAIKETWKQLSQWTKPVLVMYSDNDPHTRPYAQRFYQHIPSAKNTAQVYIKDAGHFIQEDKGEELAQHILTFMQTSDGINNN
ncbi:MAG: alpha/beta fold hydrolase [Pseudomonadales bacterium]|nr:alpha/beta fold hydrolase [Pseudomonadales bacterium]